MPHRDFTTMPMQLLTALEQTLLQDSINLFAG